MADYKARINNDLQSAPSVKAKVKELGGRLRVMFDEYIMGSDAALIGDRILFGKLPKGAKIWYVRAEVAVASFGTGVTFDLGHSAGLNSADLEAGDADSIDAAVAGDSLAMSEYKEASDFIYKELADEVYITATVGGANFDTAPTAKLLIYVEYSLD